MQIPSSYLRIVVASGFCFFFIDFQWHFHTHTLPNEEVSESLGRCYCFRCRKEACHRTENILIWPAQYLNKHIHMYPYIFYEVLFVMLSFYAIYLWSFVWRCSPYLRLHWNLLGPDKGAYCYLFAQVGVKKCHNYTNKYKSIRA